jgi:hypothetical protein
MSRTPGITTRASLFAAAYVANGGRAKAAALQAGYAPKSAGNVGSYLMRNPNVVDLIAQKIRHQVPGADETVARINHRGPAHLKARLLTYPLPTALSASAILTGNGASPPEIPNRPSDI